MAFYQSDLIYCKRTKERGRGVFARCDIPAGTTIEQTPVLVLSAAEISPGAADSVLANYVFHWGRGQVALALGYGSLYNHSYDPNARCTDVAPLTKRFTAIRDIRQDEEITFNYGGDPDSRDPVAFAVR